MKPAKRLLAKANRLRRERPLLFWLRAISIVCVALIFTIQRNFWTPDTLFLVLLALFIILGQARAFLVRFAPFLLLLLTYDSFRSIADQLNSHVHYLQMIDFDTWLGHGTLPTVALQHLLWHGSVQWYDLYFYFLYTVHFLVPVLLAVIVWKVRPKLYWQFVVAFVGLSFAAFIVFVLFPAAPPWMASTMHMIPPIHRISSDIWTAMGVTNFSEIYNNLSPNEVAAVPSLHAAYPLLSTLFIWKLFGLRRSWWVIVYPLSMWVGVVYLGEHYVFDVITGILCAVAAYIGAWAIFKAAARHAPAWRKHYQRGYERGQHIATRRSRT